MNRRTIIPWLLLLVFTPLGLFCCQQAIRERMDGKRSLTWPEADGTVLSATVVRSRSSKGRHSASPSVTYRYTVSSNTYIASRIRFAAIGGGGDGETRAIVSRYPAGRAIRVRYDPARPSEAVLEPGAFGRSWGLLAAGAVFASAGVLAWSFRRQIEARSLRRREEVRRRVDEAEGRASRESGRTAR